MYYKGTKIFVKTGESWCEARLQTDVPMCAS